MLIDIWTISPRLLRRIPSVAYLNSMTSTNYTSKMSSMPARKCLRLVRVSPILAGFDLANLSILEIFEQMLSLKWTICSPFCKVPVEQDDRNTLIPVWVNWFGQSLLATIWATCLKQFVENFDEMFFTKINQSVMQGSRVTNLLYHVDPSLVSPFLVWLVYAPACVNKFAENFQEMISTQINHLVRLARVPWN